MQTGYITTHIKILTVFDADECYISCLKRRIPSVYSTNRAYYSSHSKGIIFSATCVVVFLIMYINILSLKWQTIW